MTKNNKSVILALILSVGIVATTFIVLEEYNSVSDRIETESTAIQNEIVETSEISKTSSTSYLPNVLLDMEHTTLPTVGESKVVRFNFDRSMPTEYKEFEYETGFAIYDGFQVLDREPTRTEQTDLGTRYVYTIPTAIFDPVNGNSAFNVTMTATDEGIFYLDIIGVGGKVIDGDWENSVLLSTFDTFQYEVRESQETKKYIEPSPQSQMGESQMIPVEPYVYLTKEEKLAKSIETSHRSYCHSQIELRDETYLDLRSPCSGASTLIENPIYTLDGVEYTLEEYGEAQDLLDKMYDSVTVEEYANEIKERGFTEQEARDWLTKIQTDRNWLTYVQLPNVEDIMREAFSFLSTQNFFFPPAYADSLIDLRGFVLYSPPFNDRPGNIVVSGIKVCATDKNYNNGEYEIIKLSNGKNAY